MRVDSESLKATYLQHTKYHCFPGGLKKLEFIVEVLCGLGRAPGEVRVLDVGCGNGSLALPVASLGYPVVGVDVDAGSIEHAREVNGFPNARFETVASDSFDLGAPFDVVICSEVLEHLHQPLPLIRTIARAMKDDGLAIITVPNGQGLREAIGRVEGFLKSTLRLNQVLKGVRRLAGMPDANEKCAMHTSNVEQGGTGHVQFYSLPGLRRRLERGGLEIVRVVKSFFIFSVFAGKRGDTWTALDRFDSRLADLLPASMASGWFVLCQKAES
ncbi:MAG: methyltransferase domain-containing protein [Verrucomicrobia bacterium]|nr:methyltransferase domain-containing protein [Verrucomicrobiota bacterium]